MRAPLTAILVLASALVAGCHKPTPQAQDQNAVTMDANTIAGADIEQLPPDESSGTPSNQLVNGSDNPDVNDVNASNNSH
jgi:uncharacterized protein YcfL